MDYRFLRTEKDPIIDMIRTVIQEEYGGDINHDVLMKVSTQAGISISTLKNWLFGETLHPQNITIRMVLQALNCRIKIYRHDGTEIRGARHDKSNGRKSQKLSTEAARAAH